LWNTSSLKHFDGHSWRCDDVHALFAFIKSQSSRESYSFTLGMISNQICHEKLIPQCHSYST
jgi:hypothetical protein